jgi:hypothetical protein
MSSSAAMAVINCPAEQILGKGAKKSTARDVAIYLAGELSGESGVNLGKYFGNLCGAAVTGRYKHISVQIIPLTYLFRYRKPGPQDQVRDNRLCYKVLIEKG